MVFTLVACFLLLGGKLYSVVVFFLFVRSLTIDFSKAFDVVNHKTLLQKVSMLDLPDKMACLNHSLLAVSRNLKLTVHAPHVLRVAYSVDPTFL